MQERLCAERRGLFRGGRCQVQIMQDWVDDQPRQNWVHPYVFIFVPSKRAAKDNLLSFLTGNTCTCTNGVPETGADCPVNGAPKCASCNFGWTRTHDCTKCIRTWTSAATREHTMKLNSLQLVSDSLFYRERVHLQGRRRTGRRRLSCSP